MTISTAPQSATQARSAVKCIVSGRVTPFSMGFSRVRRSSSAFSGRWDHRVTSCPFSTSSRARAVPQPPLPTTVIFILNNLLFFRTPYSSLFL